MNRTTYRPGEPVDLQGSVKNAGQVAVKLRSLFGLKRRSRTMTYHCPYCQSEKHPVEVRKRTLLGHLCFGLVVLGSGAGLLWWGLRLVNVKDGDMGLTLALFAPALILFAAGLLVTDYVFRETFQRCPQCRRRLPR